MVAYVVWAFDFEFEFKSDLACFKAAGASEAAKSSPAISLNICRRSVRSGPCLILSQGKNDGNSITHNLAHNLARNLAFFKAMTHAAPVFSVLSDVLKGEIFRCIPIELLG